MRKKNKRKTQITIILVLFVLVISLSIGFAAFSKNVLISSSANVTPSASDFGVKFSSSSSSLATSPITPTVSGATGDSAIIDNSGTSPKITGLKANFSAPNQSVTYTFYAINIGEYEAFLKSISYEKVSGSNATKVCTKTDATATDSLVAAACEHIKVSVQVGSQSANDTTNNITNHSLAAKTGNETVTVTITYESGGDRADGDFTVAFGDIKLTYNSTDA